MTAGILAAPLAAVNAQDTLSNAGIDGTSSQSAMQLVSNDSAFSAESIVARFSSYQETEPESRTATPAEVAEETASDSVESGDAKESGPEVPPIDSGNLKLAVISAFRATHEGWSCDEVILNDRLHTEFIAAVQEQIPGASVEQASWTLLNLRKAGKLNVPTTQRTRLDVSEVTHIAEIAARSVQDRFGISSDRMMADPETRAEFDAMVLQIDPSVDPYLVRCAAFRMRKTRKLKPELITRIADWSRTIESFTVEQLRQNPELINEHPGIYIFRDATGYLYIGQSENLRTRLAAHLDQSHSESLAAYLTRNGAETITIEVHDFDPDSRARETMVRRAYESELIASRKPRFNIQP